MQLAVLNPTTNLLDLTPGVTASGGIGNQPVLTGSNGFIDPSLFPGVTSSSVITTNYEATLSIDFSSGLVQKVILTGPLALSFANTSPSGPDLTLILTQDGTGGHPTTFASNILGVNSGSLSTTASTSTPLRFLYDGTNYLLVSTPVTGQI